MAPLEFPHIGCSEESNKKKHAFRIEHRLVSPSAFIACLHRGGLLCNEGISAAYHGQRHAVYLMFIFGLVLSEGAVPEDDRERRA